MSEHKILAAVMQDRAAYQTVHQYHEKGDFSDLAELVFKEVTQYYTRDSDAECADPDSILNRLCNKYPKHADKFEKFIDNLPHVSVANILEDWREVKRDAAAEVAGSYLMAHDYDNAMPLLDKVQQLTTTSLGEGVDVPKVYRDAEADDFTDSLLQKNRIAIAPNALNRELGGGLLRGGHLIVYAPPECGKTAFAINCAYGCAAKGRVVLYIGNEETDEMYLNRMLCRFCRWPLDRVLKDKPAAMALARKRGWANLIFIPLSPGTVSQVQGLILEHSPDVVIIDQLPNLILGTGKEPEKTVKLEALAYVMRMFYSKHKIAGISMTQADEKAIGKLYLTIKDIYYSNVGVQGMCDAMIGIGMSSEWEKMGRRMLCITKNKLGGQHANVPVQLISEYSMLKEI